MNTGSLRRRVIYIAAMVLLLIPLYMLGQPSVRQRDGTPIQDGGVLARLRTKYDLGQGDLGEIDPASESMRLATLGMRGVASTILWQKAEYYKKEQYWDRFSATLNQIALLQPHFVKVWEFQSWNLSYNISVEFDDYRQRYDWVKKGIDYMLKGTKYNRRKPHLPYELGWSFGSKMGVADEKLQFRELYRRDKQFHDDLLAKGMDVNQNEGLGPDGLPDNWLSGRLWYLRAYEIVKAGALPSKGPINFYRMAPQWLINYAQAIQTEGILDQAAVVAWRRAGVGWREFGEIQMESTFGDELRLTDLKLANQKIAEAEQRFQDFCADKFNEMRENRRSLLTPKQSAALLVPVSDRTNDEMMLAMEAESVLKPSLDSVAKSMPPDKQIQAVDLAMQVSQAEEFRRHVEIYRNQINYAYWESRCEAEQSDEATSARSNLYEANKLLDKGELDEALKKYELAWSGWNSLFGKFPSMMTDDTADEVMTAIKRYQRLLDATELPKDFALNDFLEFRRRYDTEGASPYMQQVLSEWSSRFGKDRNFFENQKSKSPTDPSTSKPGETAADSTVPATSASSTTAAKSATKPEASTEPPKSAPPSDAAAVSPKPSTDPNAAATNSGVTQPDTGKPPAPPVPPAKSTATPGQAAAASSTNPDSVIVAKPDEGVPPQPKK